MWLRSRLAADEAVQALIAGRFFLFRTGTEVPAPFVVATNFATEYTTTRDGAFPSSGAFSLLCVASSNDDAAMLSQVVSASLDNGYIAESNSVVQLQREEERYDFEQQLFVNELFFNIV